MTSDIKKAGQIIESYAEDLPGLEVSECEDAGFSYHQWWVLAGALGKGSAGEITPDECAQLEQADFSKEFVEKIAGTDGRAALERRAEWLADHVLYSRLRAIYGGNYDLKDREDMMLELSRMRYIGAVPVLLQSMGVAEGNVPQLLKMALVEMGSPAVPALIKALEDSDRFVRSRAAHLLGEIKDARAVPALIEALQDSVISMHYHAAEALGHIKDTRAVPALIQAFSGSDRNMRHWIVAALGEIKDPRAVPILIVAMGDLDVSHWAVDALAQIGNPAVLDLIDAMKGVDPIFRAGAADALGHIGEMYGAEVARLSIPDLQRMAEVDPDANCRKMAKEALDKLQKKIP